MIIAHELRDAWRALVRTPSFTVPVALSLALAIGAAIAAFSVVNTLMLRRLPVESPERLYEAAYRGTTGLLRDGSNYGWFEHVRDHATTADAALVKNETLKLSRDGVTERVAGQLVSGGYFQTLGITAQLGRLLGGEDQPASRPARVAVISDALWTSRFGRDPAAVGSAIAVGGEQYVIVGVTPPEYFGLTLGQRVDITMPIDGSEYRQGWTSMSVILRLKETATAAAARTELTRLLGDFFSGAPQRVRSTVQSVELRSLVNGFAGLRGRFGDPALAVLAIVGLLLLLACANWATLLLARASARGREMRIRVALGSSRPRLVCQAVLESLMLSTAGGALGLLAAWWSVGLLGGVLPGGVQPIELRMTPDLRVFLFAASVSSLTGLLFALAPAWFAGTIQLSRGRTSGATQDARAVLVGRALVAAQVALALLLVVGATLFTATLRNLRGQDMGFAAGRAVLTFDVDAEGSGLEGPRLMQVQRQLLDRLRALPGVVSATLAGIAPLSGEEDGKGVSIPGFVPASPDDLVAQMNTIASGYTRTFGIPVVRGRDFTDADDEAAPQVALASENAARFYFPGVDPIGRRLQLRGAVVQEVEIVGVVKNVMYDGLRVGADRMFYVPFLQRPVRDAYIFAVRVRGDAGTLAPRVAAEVRALAAGVPMPRAVTLARHIDERAVNERLLVMVSVAFGGLALLLAAVGIYGIVAYLVARRTRELGVRRALGAERGHVLWVVLRGALVVTAIGLAAGFTAAAGLQRFVAGLLFGVPATDLRVHAAAAAILVVAALVACVAPVIRALRIPPVSALRAE